VKIENEFKVNAPVRQAWETVLDLERVAPCLPGAAIEESTDGEYQGTMAVRLGPISARYRGTVRIEETDEENHRVVLRASGRETRGQGSASATITSTMKEENGSTLVRVETDMEVTGKVAQFGRGIMQDVAEEMLDRFSTCVEQEIVGGAEKAPEQPAESSDREAASAEREPDGREAASRQSSPLDLASVSQQAIMRRAAPVLAGLAGLCLLAALIRLRRRPSFLLQVNGLEIRTR
jgi:carbon monoxide dehydrogenase subunit G